MGKYESKHECAKCGEFVFNETKLGYSEFRVEST